MVDSRGNGVHSLPAARSSKEPIRFGVFELDAHSGELRKKGVKIKLQEQPFQILLILLEQAPEVVTKEELQKRIWPADTFVDFDKGLYNSIKKLREALGDEAGTPRYVETVPKRGYRFIATLKGNVPGNGPAQPGPILVTEPETLPAFVPAPSRLLRWMFVGIAVFLIVLVAGVWYRNRNLRLARRLTEKDTIVLADFANSTGDAIFDDTLKTAFNISLRQSPFLNVLPDSQVAKTLQLMTCPAGTKLTPEVARELCQRAGSKVYLAGSIGSLGSE